MPGIVYRTPIYDIFTYPIAYIYCTKSGCGKREAHKNSPMVMPETAVSVTVPADSRQ